MKLRRRRFLKGVGGLVVGLPFLESVAFDEAPARAAGARPVNTIFFKQGNGVQQSWNGEPERFWPSATGALDRATLEGRDGGRAIGELAPYADKLLVVQGLRYGFNFRGGCGHAQGHAQFLTAQDPIGSDRHCRGGGQSVDWFIAEQCNPGGASPLNLIAGPTSSYVTGSPSYSARNEKFNQQNNPFGIYMDLFGMVGMNPDQRNELVERRRSVNDFVREEMTALLQNPRLGSEDNRRLTMHFDAIRDMEVQMACGLPMDEITAMEDVRGALTEHGNRPDILLMHMNLVALAFACGINRSAVVQMGECNDGTRFYVDGTQQNSFHRISHRVDIDGSDGPRIPNADVLHHEIDRIHARMFRHLLDRLIMYPGASGGTLLDDTIAVWSNDLGNGPPHSSRDLPFVIAGSGGGFLRQGLFVNVGDEIHNKMFNTLISAHGVTNPGGGYYDSFGAGSLPGGVLDDIIV
ncbi:MAG: DUF1552 domain-containing protein [Myxococcota bacterium]